MAGAFGHPEERSGRLPEWPLVVLMVVVAVVGAFVSIRAEWGDGGPQQVVAEVADHGSMLDDGRFPAALDRIGEDVGRGALVSLMRVDATQVWTVLRVPEGFQVVRLGADDTLTVDATSGPVMAGIPLARIDRGAPSRIVQALRARFGVAREDIEYLSLNSDGWYVLLLAEEGGLPGQFRARPDGSRLERIA